MSENTVHILYGKWHITVGRMENFPNHSFTVQGSEQADGRHSPQQSGFQVTASGRQWTITLEQKDFRDQQWKVQKIHQKLSFDSNEGLTMRLDSHHPPSQLRIFYPGIELICVCLDSDVSVTPPSDPYDFTVPKQTFDDKWSAV